MGEYKIDVDPEQVNKAIAQAVLDSTVGVRIKQAIERSGDEFVRGFDYTLRQAVQEELRDTVKREILEKHLATIRERVEAGLTQKVIDDLIQGLLKRIADKW